MGSVATVKALGFFKANENMAVIQIPEKKLGARDIRVRIEAVSVNPVDYQKKDGTPSTNKDKPVILGFDAAGTVIQIGSDVKHFKIGDEVLYAGDYNREGSFAQTQIVDERIVGKKPPQLSWHEAAAIPLVGLTAYEGLVEILGIKEENFDENSKKSILIVGGAGGVGSSAIQISKKLLGLKVIATASREESREHCFKLGADYIINHKKSLEEELKSQNLTGKIDYVFNTSQMNAKYFDQFVTILNPMSGIVGIAGFSEPINMAPSFMKRVSVAIECMFTKTIFGINQESQGQIIDLLARKQAEGVIKSVVTTVDDFSITNLNLGFNACKMGTNIGKLTYKNVQSYFNNAQ